MLLSGRVERGLGEGTQIGFPTANIHCCVPEGVEPGIYTSRAYLKGKTYQSITIIGVRSSAKGPLVEVHILDFTGDCYHTKVVVDIYSKLRDIKKFNSSTELITQIKKDIEAARAFFAAPCV